MILRLVQFHRLARLAKGVQGCPEEQEDLARLVNPVVRGWMDYYGRFYRSRCVEVLRHLNEALAAWVQRKFTRFRNRERAAMHWLGRVARREPYLFAHWQLEMRPAAGV